MFNKMRLFILLVFLIIINIALISSSTNIQSHTITEIDGFNLIGTNINLNASYNFNITNKITGNTNTTKNTCKTI